MDSNSKNTVLEDRYQQCPICNYFIPEKNGLDNHIKNKHVEVSSLQKEVEELKKEVKVLKGSFGDLKNFVMTQSQDKVQTDSNAVSIKNRFCIESKPKKTNLGNQRIKQETDTNTDHNFEQPLKKVKLEDQSEEIEKLNQIVKNLKEDIVKLQMENYDLKNYGSQSEN